MLDSSRFQEFAMNRLKCRAGWQERRQIEVSAEVSLVEILRRREAKQLPASAAETTVNLEILPDDKRV